MDIEHFPNEIRLNMSNHELSDKAQERVKALAEIIDAVDAYAQIIAVKNKDGDYILAAALFRMPSENLVKRLCEFKDDLIGEDEDSDE